MKWKRSRKKMKIAILLNLLYYSILMTMFTKAKNKKFTRIKIKNNNKITIKNLQYHKKKIINRNLYKKKNNSKIYFKNFIM